MEIKPEKLKKVRNTKLNFFSISKPFIEVLQISVNT